MTDGILKEFESDGCTIILEEEIARGNSRAVIYSGTYHFRKEVAIKCMEMTHYKAAIREVQLLCNVDYHNNIISYYGHKNNKQSIYIALEKCNCTLEDLIVAQENVMFQQGKQNKIKNEARKKIQFIKDFCQINGIEMWTKKRIPTDHTIKMLRAILEGISCTHEHEFIHGNLTPKNILMKFENNNLCVKILDFSMSRPMKDDIGTWGWKAPKVLNGVAIDKFNFGCTIYYCLTGGIHPFDKISKHKKIVKIGDHNISFIRRNPHAHELVGSLLHASPRVELNDIGKHPFFWILEKRIRFLCITSDRVQLAKRNQYHDPLSKSIVRAFEFLNNQFNQNGWSISIDNSIISHIESKQYTYQYDEFGELLRLFRNLSTHCEEQPSSIKVLFYSRPDGILEYFCDKFPRFFWETFKIIETRCSLQDAFKSYFVK